MYKSGHFRGKVVILIRYTNYECKEHWHKIMFFEGSYTLGGCQQIFLGSPIHHNIAIVAIITKLS